MITVCQIAIGKIPGRIRACMDSVKAFAKRKGYAYRLVTELTDSSYGSTNLRNLSEIERVYILATYPYTMWLDWGVMLTDDFDPVLEDNFITNSTGDWILYNGKDLDLFKELAAYMDRNFTNENEGGILLKAWLANKHLYTKSNILARDGSWAHLESSLK